jgi:DNA-binding winged helix-turn-helix (wHTH) protein/tetratricopeptide (TPR) repeat protein
MENEEISFGRFRLHFGRRELLRDGEPVRLHRRALDILTALAAARGEVLGKDTLMARLWPGRVVEEGNLHVHVSALRKALDEYGEGHSYVVTVPGRGYRLAGFTVAVPAARGNAERRQITVLSCELIGAAPGAGGVDLEDLEQAVRTFRRCLADTAKRHGGFIYRQLGNNALALFGYPAAHEHDAEQAVRAGLELCAAVRALAPIGEAPMRCRVGVATGLVIVGDPTESTAFGGEGIIGDVPDAAARLLASALPDMVAIGSATRRLVGDLFECRELVSTETGGYQVLGEAPATSRFEALHGAALTPLVGREEELGLLTRCWARAGDGEGQVVLVSGEAGIGKSRLCRALAEQLAADPYKVVHWQCSPHHLDSALYPIASQIGRAAGFAPGDGARQRAAKAASLFVAAELGADETALLTDLLGLSPGLPPPLASLTPRRRKQLAFDALISAIATISAGQRMLLVFEDAHWIDPSSLEFLAFALDRARRLRVLIVITARPEFALPGPDDAHIRRIVLGRMSRRESALLALRIAGKGLPSIVVEQIVDNADGVPLFIEELTKSLLEGGGLTDLGDRYEVSRPPLRLAVPTTLHDSLTARLDHLVHGKGVVQAGAAVGREFSHRLVAAALAVQPETPNKGFDELVNSELVYRRGVGPDAVYTFKHALIRAAAYDAIPRSLRQTFHGRIAAALERDDRDTVERQPELLAHHYTRAAEFEAALAHWSRAGDLAEGRGASLEATGHYRSALAVLPHVGEEAKRLEWDFDVSLKLANTLIQSQGFSILEHEDFYERARAVALRLGDPEKYVAACGQTWSGRFKDFLMLFDVIDSEQLARMSAVSRIRVAAMTGVAHFYLGNLEEAWSRFQEAMRLDDAEGRTGSPPIGGSDTTVFLRGYGAWFRAFQGYLDEAAALVDEARAIAIDKNHAHSEVWTLSLMAEVRLREGRYAEAEATANQAMDLCDRMGFEGRRGLLYRGAARIAMGRVDEGVEDLRGIVALRSSTGGRFHRTIYGMQTAEPLIAAGLYDAAEPFLQFGEQAVHETDERVGEAELLRLRGRVLLARGDSAAGEALLRQALETAGRQGAKWFALRAACDLARRYYEQGDAQAAVEMLEPIYGSFAEGLAARDLKEAAALLDVIRQTTRNRVATDDDQHVRVVV